MSRRHWQFVQRSVKIQPNQPILCKSLSGEAQGTAGECRDKVQASGRDHAALMTEIKRTIESNSRLSNDANRLTQALRADVKAQGNWGELVLSRILEASGLRENEEYRMQTRGLNISGLAGEKLIPDVLINLPDGKHIIVDSKVSLSSTETLVNAQDNATQQLAFADYRKSITAHIKGLSAKDYSGAADI